MRRFLLRRPSPAMIVALIALFLSLGGVSYGLATGSINSREIKDNNVKSVDLKDNKAVKSQDIRDGAVGAADLSGVVVRSNTVPLPDNSNASAQATCQAEERMLGGGAALGAFGDLFLLASRPTAPGGGVPANGDELTTWRASARNPAGGTGATTITAWASCKS